MTIEFHCPHCDKLLKTPDDKAGVRANCPGCGQVVTVPDPALEEAHVDASYGDHVAAEQAPPAVEDPNAAPEAGSVDNMMPCPMCGASIKKSATRCRFCGEILTRHTTGAWQPTQIDAGDVFGRSWNIYKSQFGLVFASFLIQVAIGIVLGIGIYAVLIAVVFGMIAQGGGRPVAPVNPAQLQVYTVVVGLVLTPLILAVSTFFDSGQHVLLLKVARGEQAEIGDLFSGGRFYWRILLVNFVFAVPGILGNLTQPWIAFGGTIVGLLGQFLLMLFFWPSVYVIVDRDCSTGEAFRLGRTLAAQNYVPTILLALIFLALGIAGIVGCCVGWLFTMPLGLLSFAVAYCAMSGQATAGSS